MERPTDAEFRAHLRGLLDRSRLSMRQLSAALGRDPGYVAALLDPSRPSRARPTPADLIAASDATGIPFVDWLGELWGVDRSRLADELSAIGLTGSVDQALAGLPPAERALVSDLIKALAANRPGQRRPRAGPR